MKICAYIFTQDLCLAYDPDQRNVQRFAVEGSVYVKTLFSV